MTIATTIIIKRDANRNYDRLFKAIDGATILGRVSTLGEEETARGYEVTLSYLPAEAMDFVAARPRDFDLA